MPSWVQIVILVLFASGGFFQWLIKKLAEQKAIKEQQRVRSRAQEEALRTGRNPLDEAMRRAQVMAQTQRPARPNLDDIAARRRAQLEQIRRQREAVRAGTPPQAPAHATPRPRQVGSAPRQPTLQRQPSQHPQPVRPSRAPSPQHPRRTTHGAPLPPPPATPRQVMEMLVEALPESAPRRQVSPPPSPAAPSRTPIANKWREAIVMREILDRPVADRDPLEF